MDIYGRKAVAATSAVSAKFAVVVPTRVEPSIFDQLGCLGCTSGDSPIWDLEQNILFGY